jgi:hypothetical protein
VFPFLMTIRRLFVLLFAIALITMAVRETIDPDMWWHLRTGELIVEQGLPRQDVFSFTVPEHEWITHEWLSQVFMWGVYRVGQMPGLMIVFALLIGCSFWLSYRASPGQPYLAAFITLLAAFASAIVWGARPQIFNLLMAAAFVHILERLKDNRIAPRALWVLPILTIVWANLHSGYLLGTALLGTYVVGEALQRWRRSDLERTLDWPEIRRLALVTVAGFALAAINPNGPDLWLYPFSTLGSPVMQTYIQEWHSPDFHLTVFWPFGLMMALGILSWLSSPKRPTWTEMLLFLGAAAAGLVSLRHIPLFAVVAVPITSRHLLRGMEGTAVHGVLAGEKLDSTPTGLMRLLNWLILIGALLASGAWTASKVSGNDAAIAERYPVNAVDYVEQTGLSTAQAYNSYNWGGYLIWRGLPVFVDGRADVYGDEFLLYYRQSYATSVNWREPLDDFSVDYVIMERDSALSNLLVASEQWEESFADDVAQIFVRSNGPD